MAKLNYKTLRQEVVDQIRQKILTGELKAGERLKEIEITQLLGVSRGPVREALRQIEQEGLVKYERNIGCSVAEITQHDVYEVCLLRATLEILAVQLCKGKFSNETLQKMCNSLQRMEDAAKDLYILAQEDNLFHACVIEQLGFHKLEEVWKGMNTSNLAIFCANRKGNIEDYLESHKQLLDSYEQGDIKKITRNIAQHYGVKINQDAEMEPLFSWM